MSIAGTQRAGWSTNGGGDGHILCRFTGLAVSSCDFIFDLLIAKKIDYEVSFDFPMVWTFNTP